MAVYEDSNWNKSGTIKIIILIFAIFFLFVLTLLIFLKTGFLVYLIGSGELQNLNATIQTLPELKNSSFGSVHQFYPNMKFNHNNITYLIHADCPVDKTEMMKNAFNLLSEETIVINFTSVEDNPDIIPDVEVICSPEEKYNAGEGTDFFVAGEGGAKEIVQTGRYNVINKGVILLYGNPQNAIQCTWPNTELHELIHVFGFDHSQDENSLMYPYLSSCDQKLDDSIINELIRLYSEPNLPDLYFENVSAVKKGRYLDFNITIKNSGDVEAKNVSYSILDNNDVVETKYFGNLQFGAGIILEVTNFKLLNTNSKDIKIVIDYYKKIPEIDNTNNVASLSF